MTFSLPHLYATGQVKCLLQLAPPLSKRNLLSPRSSYVSQSWRTHPYKVVNTSGTSSGKHASIKLKKMLSPLVSEHGQSPDFSGVVTDLSHLQLREAHPLPTFPLPYGPRPSIAGVVNQVQFQQGW